MPTVAVELQPLGSLYTAVVAVAGELDLASRDKLASALERLRGDVLVDLCACDFLDASTVSLLVAKHRSLQGDGHRLDLRVASDRHVTRVLTLLGLRDVLDVIDS